MRPAVSLMIPVFNRADLIGPCIDSALAQTMPDLEVVVVDGASTDETWEICLGYAGSDSRVRVFRETTNRGPVLGWWRCVEEAKGTYATFLWSDDLLQPTFLERTLPFLADADVAFAYTGAEVGPSPGMGKIRYSHHASKIMSSDAFISGTLATRDEYPVSPACALFRLEDIRHDFVTELPTEPRTDLTATGAGTDVLLFLLAASRYRKVAHISAPLAFFRAHPGSISADGRGGQVSRTYALTKAWFAGQYGREDLIPTIVAWHWLSVMRSLRRFVMPCQALSPVQGFPSTPRMLAAAARIVFSAVVGRLSWIGTEGRTQGRA